MPHVDDQLAGQAAGDMGTPPQDDLGVVFEEPLVAGVAAEAAPVPHQRSRPSLGDVVDLHLAAVVHRRGLEPTMRATDHRPQVLHGDH